MKQLNVYESSYITANSITGNKKIKLTDKEITEDIIKGFLNINVKEI